MAKRFLTLALLLIMVMGGTTVAVADSHSLQEEQVTIISPHDGISLAGTLTVPDGPGPFPAVYLIPGGSPFDRDMTLGPHRPFAIWSEELAGRGIAVLRMDDRGTGDSGGAKMAVGFEVLTADIAVGIDFLHNHTRVDPEIVGVLGHSQGAILAPRVAAELGDLAFVVMLAGSGMTFADNLAYQQADEGAGTVETNLEFTAKLTSMLGDDGGVSVTPESIAEIWGKMTADLPEARRPEAEAFIEGMSRPLVMFLSMPMFRDLLAFDPAPAIAATNCPLLALSGGQDPMRINLPSIAEAAQTRSNSNFSVIQLSDLNHMFQTSTELEKGDPAVWVANQETVSPRVLQLVGDWLEEVCQETE